MIDNKAGASGSIGVDAVAKAAPDGYTLGFAAISPLALNPHLGKSPFDPAKDIVPVASVMVSPVLLLATPVQALRARPRRRGLPQDRGERSAIADNVLDRQFRADEPNQKWVADFTYIWKAEGWLYVAVVLDLYSRRAVGWSMQASMTSQLVADALMMAVWRRGKPVALLHHSDQGSQYTS